MISVLRRDRLAADCLTGWRLALMIWVALLLAICTAVRVTAQTEGGDANPPAGEGHRIAGTVVNNVTGEPVRHALVQIANLPGAPPAMLTNSDGHFQFEHVPATDILIQARKPGFFNEQELHPDSVPQSQVPHVDRNVSDLVIKLFPEGIVFGRVATVKGAPLEDTPVRAFQLRVMDGRKRWMQTGQAMTDEDGQFRIGNLLSGQYVLAAGPTFDVGHMRVRRSSALRQEQIVTSYYPGVPELEASTPVNVVSGQQQQADFFLKPEPVFKVSGTVTGTAAGVSGGLQFITRSGETLTAPVSLEPQTRKFTAEVPAGTYLVTARYADTGGNQLEGNLAITVNSDVENVVLALGSPLVVPVQVEERATEGSGNSNNANKVTDIAQGGSVEFFSGGIRHKVAGRRIRMSSVQVRLISSENRLQAEEFQADSSSNDGLFAVRNFTSGRYTVDLQANGLWYVQSARSGNVDLLREELVIGTGRRPDPIEIVLRDDGANLSGTIQVDGQAAPGAVLVIPEQAGPSQIRVVRAAPGGEFLADRVPPGDYKLLGVDSLVGFEFRNPEVLGPYLSKATRISLQAHQQASVTVERVTIGK